MYDTQMRVAMVAQRVKVLRRKKENRLNAMLSAFSLILTGSIAGMISVCGGGGQSRVVGLYGTTMLFEDVGGYVLVSVLAFITAVVITIKKIKEERYIWIREQKKYHFQC